ncbi:hypothetical protein EOD23_29225, partial [Mesorhizobium sp. USDA-HM6]
MRAMFVSGDIDKTNVQLIQVPPISPLEGEMSPKATEGVVARGAPALSATRDNAGDLRETTPSG